MTSQTKQILVASRRSPLAIWQATRVCERLAACGYQASILEVETRGDSDTTRPIDELGGKGVFVREIEQALLSGRAHVAAHSLKDLPVEGPPSLVLAGFLARDYPRDVLVTKKQLQNVQVGLLTASDIARLPDLKVGTGSLRRRALLLSLGSRLRVCGLRGNVQTRLAYLDRGDLDAIMLSEASLYRLGLQEDYELYPLDTRCFVPSPAQGVVALQCLRSSVLHNQLQAGNPSDTVQAVDIERDLLRRLGADCSLPVGIHASRLGESQEWLVDAFVGNLEGDEARASWQGVVTSTSEVSSQLVDKLKQMNLNRILRSLGLAEL